MINMKKLLSFLCLCSSLFLFGCDKEEIREALNETKELPAQIVVDTISKLVTAESMFSHPEYDYTPESLEKLFIENEYYILVDDYTFFYCYDKMPRLFRDVEFDANYAVIGVSDFTNNILIGGTPPFRAEWSNLKQLSKNSRIASRFESMLDIQKGKCFEIELDKEYIKSLPQNKLLKKIPTERSEWEKMMKEMENFTSPIEDLFDSIRPEEK